MSNVKRLFVLLAIAITSSMVSASQASLPPEAARSIEATESATDVDALDEFDPFAPDAEERLQRMDEIYEQETGLSAHPFGSMLGELPEGLWSNGCYRSTCPVFALIEKSEQKMYLYVNGNPHAEWLVSTGVSGRTTPDFDRHPNGRIYDRYTSKKFPGGDYLNMGNMPYAVFIQGGFAIHGTGKGSWRHLGKRASHGCIRLHPDNARIFNRLVRSYGIKNVWITVR